MSTGFAARAGAVRSVVLGIALVVAGGVCAGAVATPQALRERHAALGDELRRSDFGRPLLLWSRQDGEQLSGEVVAVVDHAIDVVRAQLASGAQWCEVLLLHINTKSCRTAPAERGAGATVVQAHFGKKTEQSLDDAARVDFTHRLIAATDNYLHVSMQSPDGPMASRNYVITFEATGLEDGRSFIRLVYGYEVGFAGQLAMKTYLATIARDKVGFSRAPGVHDGLVDGMRGVIERNAMRYYLAVAVVLDTAGVRPRARQRQARLEHWFAATERYRRQLHEVDQEDYMAMKQAEFRRAERQP